MPDVLSACRPGGIDLGGNSGCTVTLEGNVVRKTSRDEAYNERLMEQARLQETSFLRHPVIRAQGVADGLYWLEMDYVAGRTSRALMADASPAEIRDCARQVLRWLRRDVHGDCTLENILWDSGPVFIDFLDGPRSYELDIAKLHQDVTCLWSWRYETIPSHVRQNIALFRDELPPADPELLRFQIERIRPYAKDSTTQRWIERWLSIISSTWPAVFGV